MKTIFPVIFTILSFTVILSSAQPIINSFSPSSGTPGTIVTITGNNFNPIASNNVVFFGTTKAIINNASSSELTVIVPNNANYQYISVTDTTTHLATYSTNNFNITPIPCSNQPFFNNFLTLNAGVNINSVAIGDLDGDGLPEIISADSRMSVGDTGYVSIIRNISMGANINFETEIKYTVKYNPVSIAVGDLNNDGKLDIVVANSDSDTLSILKNNCSIGNIAFILDAELMSGTKPYSVAINDLDGDGKLDISVANFNSNTISTFRNTTTGNISFGTKTDFVTSNGPYNLAIGDLDGDYKNDIAVSCMNSNRLSLLKNTSNVGTISFAPKSDLITDNAPYVLQMGDVDLDGKLDIAVCNSGSNSVSIFRNTSSTGISFAPKVNFNTPSGPLSISISDLDGDEKPELITSNLNSANNSVLKNTSSSGNITFEPHIDFTNNSLGWGSTGIGDLNGDSRPEIITGGTYNIGVLQSECTINIDEAPETLNHATIFPNPFENFAYINFKNDQNKIFSFRLFNTWGQCIKSEDNIISNSIKIEKAELKNGCYYFRLSSMGNQDITGKIIVK